MEQPRLHIILVGKMWDESLIHILLHRSIDELVFAFSSESLSKEAIHSFIGKLSQLGIDATIMQFSNINFETILSSILDFVNCQRFDKFRIEFNVSFANTLMAIAGCVASEILQCNVVYRENDKIQDMSEVWPSKLSNLTKRKKDILGYLLLQSDFVYQQDITEELEIPRSGVSRQLQDLEHAGYIERKTVARKKSVRITTLGASVINKKQLRKRRVWQAEKAQAYSKTKEYSVYSARLVGISDF